ncbi:MAG: MBL fold metallo-hydrolase [Blastocatellia bacterium]
MQIEKLVIPTPFPVGPINIYLLVDDPLTLVDTGPKTDAAKEALTTQLHNLGFRITDIQRIILTHTHEDHCGLASWLQQQCGAPVYVHEWEQENLTDHGRVRADRGLLKSSSACRMSSWNKWSGITRASKLCRCGGKGGGLSRRT